MVKGPEDMVELVETLPKPETAITAARCRNEWKKAGKFPALAVTAKANQT
jgi:hypothetical protein